MFKIYKTKASNEKQQQCLKSCELLHSKSWTSISRELSIHSHLYYNGKSSERMHTYKHCLLHALSPLHVDLAELLSQSEAG